MAAKSYEKKGLMVEVKNNNVDKAIKLLGQKVKKEGIIREVRQRQAFEKPSDKRRRKHAEAVRRNARALRTAND